MKIKEAGEFSEEELREYLNKCLMFGIEAFEDAKIYSYKGKEDSIKLDKDSIYDEVIAENRGMKINIPSIFKVYGNDGEGLENLHSEYMYGYYRKLPYIREINLNKCEKVLGMAFKDIKAKKVVVNSATSATSLEDKSFYLSEIKRLNIDNLVKFDTEPFLMAKIDKLEMMKLEELRYGSIFHSTIEDIYARNLRVIKIADSDKNRIWAVKKPVIHTNSHMIKVEVCHDTGERKWRESFNYLCKSIKKTTRTGYKEEYLITGEDINTIYMRLEG